MWCITSLASCPKNHWIKNSFRFSHRQVCSHLFKHQKMAPTNHVSVLSTVLQQRMELLCNCNSTGTIQLQVGGNVFSTTTQESHIRSSRGDKSTPEAAQLGTRSGLLFPRVAGRPPPRPPPGTGPRNLTHHRASTLGPPATWSTSGTQKWHPQHAHSRHLIPVRPLSLTTSTTSTYPPTKSPKRPRYKPHDSSFLNSSQIHGKSS